MRSRTSNSLYRASQQKAMTVIGAWARTGAAEDLPEITWHIGLQGAAGECDTHSDLVYWAKALGLPVHQHRRHHSTDAVSGVHLRFDPQGKLCPCGKPAEHIYADEDSAAWACLIQQRYHADGTPRV